MKNLNAIKEDLRQHSGGDIVYHTFNPRCCYSIGAKDYFTQAECWWLWDIIQSDMYDAIKTLPPDTYYLVIKVKHGEADLELENWQEEIIYKRHIDFTDHPIGEMELVFGWDSQRAILCLHSEN